MSTQKVKTLAAFREARTFCPPVGTVGRIVRNKGPYKVVRFNLPMPIDGGGEVLPGDCSDYLDLYFMPNELEYLTSSEP